MLGVDLTANSYRFWEFYTIRTVLKSWGIKSWNTYVPFEYLFVASDLFSLFRALDGKTRRVLHGDILFTFFHSTFNYVETNAQ